jgi:hypothetical protein
MVVDDEKDILRIIGDPSLLCPLLLRKRVHQMILSFQMYDKMKGSQTMKKMANTIPQEMEMPLW